MEVYLNKGNEENKFNVYIRNEEGKLEKYEFLHKDKYRYVNLTRRHEMMKEALEIKNRII